MRLYEEELVTSHDAVTVGVGFFWTNIPGFRICDPLTQARMDLCSPGIHITCHYVQFGNLILLHWSHPFAPSVRLLFIVDSHRGDLSTHGGLLNHTLFLHVSINNPVDAIIHVAILINTLEWKHWVVWLRPQQQFYGGDTSHIFVSSLQSACEKLHDMNSSFFIYFS